MLTISDVEKAVKRHFEVESTTDGIKIKDIKGLSSVCITIDEENVIIKCDLNTHAFINKIPINEFIYCKEADSKEIYMLRMFCRKCKDFLYCSSVKKSLSECEGNVFVPTTK